MCISFLSARTDQNNETGSDSTGSSANKLEVHCEQALGTLFFFFFAILTVEELAMLNNA